MKHLKCGGMTSLGSILVFSKVEFVCVHISHLSYLFFIFPLIIGSIQIRPTLFFFP